MNTRSETPVLHGKWNITRLSSLIQLYLNVCRWNILLCFAVQLFSPSLLFLSLAVSETKKKKLKNTSNVFFFATTGGSCFLIKKDPIIQIPRQAEREADSFCLTIYRQIPSGHSNAYNSTSKLSKLKFLVTIPTHYQVNRGREKRTHQLGIWQIS